jgi:FKBP-type peptidyl-prolyl cis-trans isomerase 2
LNNFEAKNLFFLEELSSIDAKLSELNDKVSVEEIKEAENEVLVDETPLENPILDVLGNGSLIKRVLKRGEREKRPKNGQICRISYQMRLASNLNEVVEDNLSFEFILGDGDVVPGLF